MSHEAYTHKFINRVHLGFKYVICDSSVNKIDKAVKRHSNFRIGNGIRIRRMIGIGTEAFSESTSCGCTLICFLEWEWEIMESHSFLWHQNQSNTGPTYNKKMKFPLVPLAPLPIPKMNFPLVQTDSTAAQMKLSMNFHCR